MKETTARSHAGLARQEKLDLADWRRRVGELYAEVRELSATDPPAAWEHWCRIRELLFRGHPASPVPPEKRPGFVALHFDYDARLRFELPVIAEGATPTSETARPGSTQPHATAVGGYGGKAGAFALPISVGRPLSFERVCWIDVPFPSGLARLALFWLPEYAGGLFLPFRDATNGIETYGGGRYLLDTSKGADLGGDADRGTVIVDLNFAYQPSCAFDQTWSCPLSPPENRLDIRVEAGERLV